MTKQGAPLPISVLANDSDPDGDALTITGLTTPAHGTTALKPNGTVLYAPASGFVGIDTGTDTFSYLNASSNTPPVAVSDPANTNKNAPVTVVVLANDGDVDGNKLNVTNLSAPPNGKVTLKSDETVTYTPNTGFTGSDSFTYHAFDGTSYSSVATVSVTVTNRTPAAVNDAAKTRKGTAVTISVLANGSLVDFCASLLLFSPLNATAAEVGRCGNEANRLVGIAEGGDQLWNCLRANQLQDGNPRLYMAGNCRPLALIAMDGSSEVLCALCPNGSICAAGNRLPARL